MGVRISSQTKAKVVVEYYTLLPSLKKCLGSKPKQEHFNDFANLNVN